MATRNRASILNRCLREYDNQTFRDFEIIVSDNGSTDSTLEMLQKEHPSVHVIRFNENVGPLALNAAAERAQGELLWRTDDDAFPETPTTLADAVQFMDTHPDVVALSGEVIEATSKNQPLNYYPFPVSTTKASSDGLPFYTFTGTSAMIRKNRFVQAGGFWDEFYCEEEDLSIRMLRFGGTIQYVPWVRSVHLCAFAESPDLQRRWQLKLTQTIRMQWRYWPALVACYRTAVIGAIMLILALFHRIPVRYIIKSYAKSAKGAIKAYTAERVEIPYRLLRTITMQRSVWGLMLHYYWKRFQTRYLKK